jgi:hypothetical protein
MDRKVKGYKIGILIISCILPLVLMAWLPLTVYGRISSTALNKIALHAPGTIAPNSSATAVTPDPTMTALEKAQLTLQVEQLRLEDERSLGAWIWNNGPVFAVLITILVGVYQFLRNLRNEQRRRTEDRFQSVIDGLAGERTETKVGAAIMLRTFLAPAYKRFHVQVFDLSVASLRSQKSPDPNASSPSLSSMLATLATITSGTRKSSPKRQELPTSLSQALVVVFKESLPLARRQLKKHTRSFKFQDTDVSDKQKRSLLLVYKQLRNHLKKSPGSFKSQDLDATGIRLDNAYLAGADLNEVWLPEGSLVRANLTRAELNDANLAGADLTGARLNVAELNGTNLRRAILTDAILNGAELTDVQFAGASLGKADLTGADLTGANPEEARTLTGAIMRNVVGLSDPQRQACKNMHAIVEGI